MALTDEHVGFAKCLSSCFLEGNYVSTSHINISGMYGYGNDSAPGMGSRESCYWTHIQLRSWRLLKQLKLGPAILQAPDVASSIDYYFLGLGFRPVFEGICKTEGGIYRTYKHEDAQEGKTIKELLLFVKDREVAARVWTQFRLG